MKTARVLAAGTWLTLATGTIVQVAISPHYPGAGQWVLTIGLAVFFLLLLARLGVAAWSQPRRRAPLVLLLVSVLIWAAGSAVLNVSGQADRTRFPAPGEWLFLVAYTGIAAYLVVEPGQRVSTAAATWLETAVICGGSACLAGSLLVAPAAGRIGESGPALLLALLYPMIDIILGLLVVAQLALRARGPARNARGLLAGFALFAVADTGFLMHLHSGTYDYSTISVVMWGVGFALIVGNACRARENEPAPQSPRGVTTLVVSAALAAGFVLAFQETGTIRNYLVLPALATLCAAGARLGLALRAAQRTAEAIALSRSDDLTELPNRRAVLAVLDAKLATNDALSLMILDLDGFKDVNDTLGHGAGDTVLREVAANMRSALDPQVMIARLGGDEFAVIAPTQDEGDLQRIANAMLEAVRAPLVIDGITLTSDASIGITVREPADRLSSQVLRRADVAMYDAKHRRVGVALYDAQGDDFSRDKLRLSDELRRAIKDHELELWYQPQIDAATRQTCGLEALVRWHHPVHGMILPDAFLSVARRVGLMQALSEEVGRMAVADLVRWQAVGVTPQLAINCSPPELMSGLFLPRLKKILTASGLPADRIVIEVTEESFLSEPKRAHALLLDVRSDGFQISIDDYGTGFSSLSYLRDLPVQELKIDRSFVSTMSSEPRTRMIVASTLQMAHALGLRTVAEGVEDAATAAALVAMGADVLQGYHLGRPMPASEVEGWMLNHAYALS